MCFFCQFFPIFFDLFSKSKKKNTSGGISTVNCVSRMPTAQEVVHCEKSDGGDFQAAVLLAILYDGSLFVAFQDDGSKKVFTKDKVHFFNGLQSLGRVYHFQWCTVLKLLGVSEGLPFFRICTGVVHLVATFINRPII